MRKSRISAAAFQNTTNSDEMSVDWAYFTTAAATMSRRPERAVAQFRQRVCDELQQACRYDPVPDNEAHCAIVGNKHEAVRAGFVRVTRLVLWPPGFIVPDALKVSEP